MLMNTSLRVLLMVIVPLAASSQNIGINTTGALPDAKAMLDISSTTSGLLIPRMTTVQRDQITNPPTGLYIYNLTTKAFNVFNGTAWESIATNSNSVILVRSMADLPAASGGAITLSPGRTYLFSGVVDISPNYINMNGSAVRGLSPLSDVIVSTVAGAILRSTDNIVHVEQITIVPASSSTTAFSFSDATDTHTCAILTGTSVRGQTGTAAGSVGQISGFRDAIIINNLWDVHLGLQFGGSSGGVTFAYNIVHGLASGPALDFISGLTSTDVNISNNYFDYTGSVVVRAVAGAVDDGRMVNNNFRGSLVSILSGFDSHTPGWEMSLNKGVPNSRSYGFAYMDGNTTPTSFGGSTTNYVKVAGAMSLITGQKFSLTADRLTYLGRPTQTMRVFVTMGGKVPSNGADYTIAIGKNGTVLTAPTSSSGSSVNNQAIQIVLETELSLATNDYVEVFIRANTNAADFTVADMQFRVSEQ